MPLGSSSAGTVRRAASSRCTRRWRQLRLEVGTGPIELAVTDDNTTEVKDRALVLLDCRPAVARDLPGNALGDELSGAGSLRSGEKVARSLAEHPRVCHHHVRECAPDRPAGR